MKGEFVKYCNTCNHKTYKMKMKSTVDLLWYETFIKLFSFEDKQYPSPFFLRSLRPTSTLTEENGLLCIKDVKKTDRFIFSLKDCRVKRLLCNLGLSLRYFIECNNSQSFFVLTLSLSAVGRHLNRMGNVQFITRRIQDKTKFLLWVFWWDEMRCDG